MVPLEPDTLHTPVPLEESTENTTGLPDPPPVADRSADPSTEPAAGAVMVIDWAMAFTVIVCWAWGAGWYLALPACLASMRRCLGRC